MKGLTVHIPENLDIDQLLKDHPPDAIKSFNKDHLVYVICLLNISTSRYKELLEDGKYIPIHTGVLKGIISNGDQYLKYLLSANVFITDGQYIVGEKSRGYLLNKQYRGKNKPYSIKYSKLIWKLKNYYENQVNKDKAILPYLYKWFNEKKLTIDKDHVHAILEEKYKAKLLQKPRKGSALTKKHIADLSKNSWTSHINRLYKKNYKLTFAVDSQGGRLYTVLTNLSRDFRRFVNYDGQPLVHVDIANSQPYFSALLLNPAFWALHYLNSKQRAQIHNETIRKNGKTGVYYPDKLSAIKLNKNLKNQLTDFTDTIINRISDNNCDSTYLMFVNNDNNECGIEFERYRKLVSSGELYEYFIKEYNLRTGKELTREEAKKTMFEIFFSPNPFILSKLPPKSRHFKELFPNVFELFKKIKSNSHNTLAILLQNIESQALLHHVCARIAAEHKHIPIFTIHDSIVTTVGNEFIVEKIMRDELIGITGLCPTLKIEYWK
jgi:hypothetical protein